jgi:hypothetical protein
MKKFVLSSNEFDSIKSAEDKVNGWWTGGGDGLNRKTKLYRVVDKYGLRIKFQKIKS